MHSKLRHLIIAVLLTCAFSSNLYSTQIDSLKLSESLEEKITAIPELLELRRIADQMGIKLWALGGTANSLVYYAKWDQLRRLGDTRFEYGKLLTPFARTHKFNDTIDSIIRTNQDIDLVIDGTDEQLKAFEALAHQVLGRNSRHNRQLEVRNLRKPYGDKYAIIGDYGFENQNTDDHSLMLVELSSSKKPQKVFNARDIDDTHPEVIEHIISDEIHFYHSPNHKRTARFLRGQNPEIFSVIRYLIKAFQFGLKIPATSEGKIKKIIQDFSKQRDVTADNDVWLRRNIRKLIIHSLDIERTYDVLKKLGLWDKLRQIGDSQEIDSPAWWMNKEPLPTKPFGKTGKTARELGITIVSHDTINFDIFEAISSSPFGIANVFASRPHQSGESASDGYGFYTAIGTKGGLQSTITVRFTVHPQAIEGIDFILTSSGSKKEGSTALFLNRAALTVIPESVSFSLGLLLHAVVDSKLKKNLGAFYERLLHQFNHLKKNAVSLAIKSEAHEFFSQKLKRSESIPLSFIKSLMHLDVVPQEIVIDWLVNHNQLQTLVEWLLDFEGPQNQILSNLKTNFTVSPVDSQSKRDFWNHLIQSMINEDFNGEALKNLLSALNSDKFWADQFNKYVQTIKSHGKRNDQTTDQVFLLMKSFYESDKTELLKDLRFIFESSELQKRIFDGLKKSKRDLVEQLMFSEELLRFSIYQHNQDFAKSLYNLFESLVFDFLNYHNDSDHIESFLVHDLLWNRFGRSWQELLISRINHFPKSNNFSDLLSILLKSGRFKSSPEFIETLIKKAIKNGGALQPSIELTDFKPWRRWLRESAQNYYFKSQKLGHSYLKEAFQFLLEECSADMSRPKSCTEISNHLLKLASEMRMSFSSLLEEVVDPLIEAPLSIVQGISSFFKSHPNKIDLKTALFLQQLPFFNDLDLKVVSKCRSFGYEIPRKTPLLGCDTAIARMTGAEI